MKKIIFIFVFVPLQLLFSQYYKISGTVTDTTEIPLPHINIVLEGTNFGDASDENGYYEISNLSPGSYNIKFSGIGYKSFVKSDLLITDKSIILNVVLKEAVFETGEIVITAGKYEQKLLEMPVSVEIIHGRELQKNYLNIEDAFRNVPGIIMTEEQMSIRGSSGYSKGAGTRVLVTLDGVPLYTGGTGEIIWEQIPITDIERIEVLKGPASSLYGSTAIGGVINIITKKSTGRAITHFKVYGGFYDNPSHKEWKWQNRTRTFYETTLTHSNSINNFGYSLSFKKIDDDSYRKDDFKKRLLGYMKLSYNISPESSVSLLANYLHMNRGNFLYWMNSRNVLIQKEEDQDKTVESDRWFLSMIYKQQLSKNISAELKSSYYYSKFDGKGIEITSSKADLYRNELLMNFRLSNNIILISGAEVSYAEVNSDLFSSPEFFTAAGFAQGEYKGIKNLTATLGLRYDHIKLDTLLGADAYTPKVGLNYSFSENLIWRGSFGTGFRAPTPAEVFTTSDLGMGITIKENLDLEAETSVSYETGLKYIPSKYINLDLALFHTTYDNFIEPEITADNEIQLVNVIEAKIQGFELVTNISIIPYELQLITGYTYLWARNTKLNKAMKYRPRHQLYVNLEYTPPPFEFRVDFRYWSRVEEIDFRIVDLGLVKDGELRVPGYVLDIRAGYNISFANIAANIFVSVKNALNYNYVEAIGNLRPIRNFSLGMNLFL